MNLCTHMGRQGLAPVAHIMMCGTGRADVTLADGYKPKIGDLAAVIRVDAPVLVRAAHLVHRGRRWEDPGHLISMTDDDRLVGLVAVAYGGNVAFLTDETDSVELLP